MTTVYQAGNNNVQDVVQASLSNGATAQVVITKTGVGPGRSIALALPIPRILWRRARFAIITATVKDSGNNLVSGALVRFSMTTANGSISRNELQTDGNGVASIVYYAGNNLAQDILQATTDDGGFAQLVITKTGQVVGYTATMIANPVEFTEGAGGGPWICNSILDGHGRGQQQPPGAGSACEVQSVVWMLVVPIQFQVFPPPPTP